ncbi:MAG: hypothetical protein JSV79_12910, partial [Armatimonadota bacterium]
DLMAQLSWVTDCAFACADSAEDTVYYLLSTGIAQGAAAAMQEREAQAHQEHADRIQAARDRVVQIKEALQLPREDAIDLYLGRDDALLLTILDPTRRAAAQIVCRHALPLLESMRFDPTAYMADSIDIHLPRIRQVRPNRGREGGAAYCTDCEDPQRYCDLLVRSDGLVALGPPQRPGDPRLGLDSYIKLIEPRAEMRWCPQDELALRRALGEAITPADEEAYLAQRTREIAAAEEERARQRRAAGRALSLETLDLLTKVVLPLPTGAQHPAWRIEEDVATATGLHVSADGLLDARAAMPSADAEPGSLNALSALEVFCSASGRDFMRSPEWEWGDAGRFLRFRTTNRDVWRAAMLPQSLLDWLDRQIEPHLPKAATPEEPATQVAFDLPLDAEQWARWIAGVSDLQIRYGALVPCGEPGNLLDAARRSAWQAATEQAQRNLTTLRFLGSLNAAQWQYARDATLKSPRDLSPDQVKRLEAAMVEKSMSTIDLQRYDYVIIALSEGPRQSSQSQTVVPVGYYEHNQSAATRVITSWPSGEPERATWHRVSLTAIDRIDGDQQSSLVFERVEPFLPTSIQVSVGAPPRQD